MKQSSNRSTMIAFLWLSVAAVVLIGGPIALFYITRQPPYNPGSDEDIVATVTGVWVWKGDSCADSPQHISFNPDFTEMYLVQPDQHENPDSSGVMTTTYRVVQFLPDGVRGAIIGESRLTAAGEPVVWDLVLRDPDTYVWRRTDLSPASTTRENHRCH